MVKRKKVKGYKNTLHLQFRTVTFQIYKFNLAFKSFDTCLEGRGRLGPQLTKILDYSPLQRDVTRELQRVKFRASLTPTWIVKHISPFLSISCFDLVINIQNCGKSNEEVHSSIEL